MTSFSDNQGGPQSHVTEVHEQADVGSARRAASRVAFKAGMDETTAGALALVVTEAATNMARYARNGLIILRESNNAGNRAIEMIAIDRGDGISDMSKALGDGFSTGGTRGQGLGAIKRNSTGFDIWSSPGCGTAIVARFALPKAGHVSRTSAGVVCTALAGESTCGDGWLAEEVPAGTMLIMVDGLGHGPDAALAASKALGVGYDRRTQPMSQIISSMHGALRSTRGAAVQIVLIEKETSTVRSLGVGNISTFVSTHAASKGIPAQPGIVGHQLPNLREIVVPWPESALLVMHTDGISTRWKLDSYPGLRLRDPALVAAVLYRDFVRGRDDATVLVSRAERMAGPGST